MNDDMEKKPNRGSLANLFIGVTEAAKLKDVNDSTIRHAIISGRLPADKVGRAWLIRRSVLAQWQPMRQMGPKKKVKERAGE